MLCKSLGVKILHFGLYKQQLTKYVIWLALAKNSVCVCSTRLLPTYGSLLLQKRNRRDILNTTLLTRITAHKQWESKHHIQSLENDTNE